GETDSNVEGLSELLATGFRDEQLSTLLDSLYGAAIKFKDTMKFEGIADGLQETLATGAAIGPFSELLERSGVALDGFNQGLTAAIANGTQEQYVLDVLAKTGLAGTYEAYRKNNEEMVKAEEANFRMQQAFAKLGATLEPILTPLIDMVTNLIGKFNTLSPTGQKVILIIAGLVAAIGPLLIVIGSLLTILPVLGTAIGAISLPIVAVIAGITALVAAGVLLYKNWDTVKEKLTSTWGSIKRLFSGNIEALKSGILNLVSTIKNLFANMRIEIPRPKLPHISVNTRYKSMGGISIPYPDFDLSWYRMGGIFDRPSIIGVGEAGTEAVIPLDKLPGLISEGLKGIMGNTAGTPIELVVNLDGREISRSIYDLQSGLARSKGVKG
ncbi:MAG: hypothetical protein WC147_12550, partial [Syntrophomonas sp.]